jgi:hypothetical protein
MPLVRSRLGGALAGPPGVASAVGGALLGVHPRDGGAGPLSIGPLLRVMGLGAEGLLGVGDLVGVPVLLDLGRGLAPGPPTPGRPRRRPQGLQDIRGPVGLNGYSCGPPLPGQGPVAVHIAARVMAAAAPGELLTSSTVRDLVVGSDIAMTDRGPHPLRGVDGTWQLYAASP